MKHRYFVKFVLRKRWPGMKDKSHSIYIGYERGRKYRRELTEWCEDQDGEWYRSENDEKYFFSNPLTAFAFKMRWAGAPLNDDTHA